MTNPTDPRPAYTRSLAWVRNLMAAVDPGALDCPTPCTEYDVRALLGHLVATVDRARCIGEGGDVFAMPVVVTGVPDEGWAEALTAAAEKTEAVWTDDSLLDREVTVPWGTLPGRGALWGYVNEALVHGWDLAVATGQDPEADPDLAEAALVGVQAKLPADRSSDRIPFNAAVESAPTAGATERLANFSGHGRS